MRITERIELIDKLGRELQSRYSYDGIDLFFAAYDVAPPQNVNANSKWIYSKAALRDAPEDVLLRMAAELEMPVSPETGSIQAPPRNWRDTKLFRLFISHISKDKLIATRLKEALTPYAISGFVAHEDIHPTLEWQGEIERALYAMDAFIAVHTKGFSQSFWTQQEVGFAVGRGAKVISFKMGEDPTGFISKHQALARRNRTAEQIAEEIDRLLTDDRRTSDRLGEAKASVKRHAGGAFDDLNDVPF